MKSFTRIMSFFLAVSFFVTSIGADYAYAFSNARTPTIDHLATPSRLDDISGLQINRMTRAKYALEAYLLNYAHGQSNIDQFALSHEVGEHKIKADSVFQGQFDGMKFLFNGMTPVPDSGLVAVECKVNDKHGSETFHAIFSLTRDINHGFPVHVYTKKEVDINGIRKLAVELPKRKLAQEEALRRDLEGERIVDAWIREERMKDGLYAVSEKALTERKGLYDSAMYQYKDIDIAGVLAGIHNDLIAMGVERAVAQEVYQKMRGKNIVLLPVDSDNPTINMLSRDGRSSAQVKVSAHSSDNAIYLMVDKRTLDLLVDTQKRARLKKGDKYPLDLNKAHRSFIADVSKALLYETGVHLGLLGYAGEDGNLHNLITDAHDSYKNSRALYEVPQEFAGLKVVSSFAECSLDRDHAAGREASYKPSDPEKDPRFGFIVYHILPFLRSCDDNTRGYPTSPFISMDTPTGRRIYVAGSVMDTAKPAFKDSKDLHSFVNRLIGDETGDVYNSISVKSVISFVVKRTDAEILAAVKVLIAADLAKKAELDHAAGTTGTEDKRGNKTLSAKAIEALAEVGIEAGDVYDVIFNKRQPGFKAVITTDQHLVLLNGEDEIELYEGNPYMKVAHYESVAPGMAARHHAVQYSPDGRYLAFITHAQSVMHKADMLIVDDLEIPGIAPAISRLAVNRFEFLESPDGNAFVRVFYHKKSFLGARRAYFTDYELPAASSDKKISVFEEFETNSKTTEGVPVRDKSSASEILKIYAGIVGEDFEDVKDYFVIKLSDSYYDISIGDESACLIKDETLPGGWRVEIYNGNSPEKHDKGLRGRIASAINRLAGFGPATFMSIGDNAVSGAMSENTGRPGDGKSENIITVNPIEVEPTGLDILRKAGDDFEAAAIIDAQRVDVVKGLFKKLFGKSHTIITKAGGRDNAQGEHVDYPEEQIKSGEVHLFSMGGAIQNNYLAALSLRSDGIVRIAHADGGQVAEFKASDLKALQAIAIKEREEKVPADKRIIPAWANHTMGVLMQAVETGRPFNGADILLTSNVPHGAGLSNSAANCIAVTTALNETLGYGMDSGEIVAFARDGEHDAFVGSTCGWLDQLLIMFSKKGFFAMIDYATKNIKYFKSGLPPTLQRVLANTNIPHDLAVTEYSDRNLRELPKAYETLRHIFPDRKIAGSASLTLGELNYLISLFDPKAPMADFADRELMLKKGLVDQDFLDGIDDVSKLPQADEIFRRFESAKYEKPAMGPEGRKDVLSRHENLTPEQSFALCLRRMRHQLTSSIRTPLTGKAAEMGDVAVFGELINAEGRSLCMKGDFQITGDNGAQDELLRIGFSVGEDLRIEVYGRMEGGGGGGNVGFYVDRSDEALYVEWKKRVAAEYKEWVENESPVKERKGEGKVEATFIEPVLYDGAKIVEILDETGRPVIETGNDKGYDLVRLTNPSGNSIEVFPGKSATIRSLKVAGAEILYYPKGEVTSDGGIPGPFFFFANRIKGGKFEWKGKEYDLTPYFGKGVRDDGNGNALHGILQNAAWSVDSYGRIAADESTGRPGSVSVTLSYNAGEDELFKKIFGINASAKLLLTYRLTGSELSIETHVVNDGKEEFPFSTAIHPWFGKGDSDKVKFASSARKHWMAEGCIPSGLEEAAERHNFTTEKEIEGTYDDAYTDLRFDNNGFARATLERGDGVKVTFLQDRSYPHTILWAPSNIPNVSVEAQSSANNAFNMQADKDATLSILSPGEDWKGRVVVRADVEKRDAGVVEKSPDGIVGAMSERVTQAPELFLEPDFFKNGNAATIYLLDSKIDPDMKKGTHHAVILKLSPIMHTDDYRNKEVIFDICVVPSPYPVQRSVLNSRSNYKGYVVLKFDEEAHLEKIGNISINSTRSSSMPWLADDIRLWLHTQIGKPFAKTNETFPVFTEGASRAAEAVLNKVKTAGTRGKASMEKRAIEELRRLGITAIPVLIEGIKDSDKTVSRIAEQTLINIGPVAASSLIDVLKDVDDSARARISTVLEHMDQDAVQPLKGAMNDPLLRLYAGPILQAINPATPTIVTASPILDISKFPAPSEGSLRERTIIVYGGLGAVMDRFYKGPVAEFARKYNVKLVCVDLAPGSAAAKKMKELNLPFEAYIHVPPSTPLDENVGKFLEDVLREKPAGVLILTRPDTHLDIIKWAIGKNKADHEMQVFVEKPIVLPEHTEDVRKIEKEKRGSLLAIDFFFDNPSALDAVKLLTMEKFGKLKSVRGRMIEDILIERGREWLVDRKIAGGGMGMDMMVHLVALGEMLLERFGKSFKNAEIDQRESFLSRYKGSIEGAETYARLVGNIDGVPIDLGAGKGTHTNAYYMILEGEKGELEINLGTENTPAFLELRGTSGEVIYHQDYGVDIGYRGAVRKIFDKAQQLGTIQDSELDFRTKATATAVDLLEKLSVSVKGNYQTHEFKTDPDIAPRMGTESLEDKFPNKFALKNVKRGQEDVIFLMDGPVSEGTATYYMEGAGREHCGFGLRLLNDRMVVSNLQVPFRDIYDSGIALTILSKLLAMAKVNYPDTEMPLLLKDIRNPEILRVAENIFRNGTMQIYQSAKNAWYDLSSPDLDIYKEFGSLLVLDEDVPATGQLIDITKDNGIYRVVHKPNGVNVTMDGYKAIVSDQATGRLLGWVVFDKMDFALRGIPANSINEPQEAGPVLENTIVGAMSERVTDPEPEKIIYRLGVTDFSFVAKGFTVREMQDKLRAAKISGADTVGSEACESMVQKGFLAKRDRAGTEEYYITKDGVEKISALGSREFVAMKPYVTLGGMTTELPNPHTNNFSEVLNKNTAAGLEMLAGVEDSVNRVFQALPENKEFQRFVEEATERAMKGHRIFLLGVGSSGRAGIDVEAKWREYWRNVRENEPAKWQEVVKKAPNIEDAVVYEMGGGSGAITRAVEKMEDGPKAIKYLKDHNFTKEDILWLISASGSAPFNLYAGNYAVDELHSTNVRFLCCSEAESMTPASKALVKKIGEKNVLRLIPGPQAITGSTRMQAGTITLLGAGAMMLAAAKNIKEDITGNQEAYLKEVAGRYPSIIDAIKQAAGQAVRGLAAIADIGAKVLREGNFLNPTDSVADKGHITFVTGRESGRATAIDGVELVPTFGVAKPLWPGEKGKTSEVWTVIGDRADKPFTNQDAWEALCGGKLRPDEEEFGLEKIDNIKIGGQEAFDRRNTGDGNLVVGVLMGKETSEFKGSFTEKALNDARARGARTALIVIHDTKKRGTLPAEVSAAGAACDSFVSLDVQEDEFLLNQSAALKATLNILSTATMGKLGAIYGNIMIGMHPSNNKLKNRIINIILRLSDAKKYFNPDGTLSAEGLKTYGRVSDLLYGIFYRDAYAKSQGRTLPSVGKIAVMMERLGISYDEAVRILQDVRGDLSAALKHGEDAADSGIAGAMSEKIGAVTSPYYIGMSMGGTKLFAALYRRGDDGKPATVAKRELLWKEAFPGKTVRKTEKTPTGVEEVSPSEMLGLMIKSINEMLVEKGLTAEDLNNAGCTSPGPLNEDAGVIGSGMKTVNLPFEEYPFVENLSAALGIPFVTLRHDGHSGLEGEVALGLLGEVEHGYYVIQGTGLGGSKSTNRKYDTSIPELTEPGHHIVRTPALERSNIGKDTVKYHYRMILGNGKLHPYEVVERPDPTIKHQITREEALRLISEVKLERNNLIWMVEGEQDLEDTVAGGSLLRILGDKDRLVKMFGGSEEDYANFNNPGDLSRLALNGGEKEAATAKRIIQYIGEETGKAMACLAATCKYYDWPLERIVIGSTVGEKLGTWDGSLLTTSDGEDFYYHYIREAAYVDMRDHFKLPEEEALQMSRQILRSPITQDERETAGFDRTERNTKDDVTDKLKAVIPDAAVTGDAIMAGGARYTLMVDSNLYRDGELEEDMIGYVLADGRHIGAGSRFDIEPVTSSKVENILSHVDEMIKTKGLRAEELVIQVSSLLEPGQIDKLRFGLNEKFGGKGSEVRILRIDTTGARSDSSVDIEERKMMRFNLYATLLAARQATDEDIRQKNSIYRTLEFYIRSRMDREGVTDDDVTEYMTALMNNNTEYIVNHALAYKPAERWKVRAYHLVTAALICA